MHYLQAGIIVYGGAKGAGRRCKREPVLSPILGSTNGSGETVQLKMPYDHPARLALAPQKQLRALAPQKPPVRVVLPLRVVRASGLQQIRALAAFAAFALAAHGLPALAALGGGLESIDADRVHMKAQKQALVSASPTYTVHEVALPGGTSVRQYVSGNGMVFAVAWSGPFKPDLRQLLGPYFDVMVAHQSNSVHAGQPRTHVREKNLVIESGGHMRNFYGRAYLSNELPAGLTQDDIQ